MVENYVLQELKASQYCSKYYWESEGRAEVDFVVENFEQIQPLEMIGLTSRMDLVEWRLGTGNNHGLLKLTSAKTWYTYILLY